MGEGEALRPAIERLLELGPSSGADAVTDAWLEEVALLLPQVEKPVSDDEARALATLFGPDDCFGLSWTLLHLIETAPGWPLEDVLSMPRNLWIDALRQAVENAKLLD